MWAAQFIMGRRPPRVASVLLCSLLVRTSIFAEHIDAPPVALAFTDSGATHESLHSWRVSSLEVTDLKPQFSENEPGIQPAVRPVMRTPQSAQTNAEPEWRPLPLIADGRLAEGWTHVGWGGFVVDDGALRTDCSPRGLGLLVYGKERFGNCQLRVVFKSKDAKSNAGIFVRIADGILEQVNRPGAVFDRDPRGKISPASMQKMMASAEREEGPWFAVHRGYEVQIMDANDPLHRTGSIYSLAASAAVSKQPPGEWKTMIITLAGHRVFVDVDGQRVTRFDPAAPDVPRERKWFEPKREPKRPETGYIGLQNHDPGDIVWIREVSVRPLPESDAK